MQPITHAQRRRHAVLWAVITLALVTTFAYLTVFVVPRPPPEMAFFWPPKERTGISFEDLLQILGQASVLTVAITLFQELAWRPRLPDTKNTTEKIFFASSLLVRAVFAATLLYHHYVRNRLGRFDCRDWCCWVSGGQFDITGRRSTHSHVGGYYMCHACMHAYCGKCVSTHVQSPLKVSSPPPLPQNCRLYAPACTSMLPSNHHGPPTPESIYQPASQPTPSLRLGTPTHPTPHIDTNASRAPTAT